MKIAICIFLVVATLAVYWQIQDHEFLYFDDNQYVTDNLNVKTGFTRESIVWAFTTSHAANWHPVTWLSHILDYQLYGLHPKGHLLTNLLIHIANALLLFTVLLRMTGALWQSGFVAALFALHPFNVESVAWAAERKNVLSTLFWLLTTWAYIRYTEKPTVKKYGWVALFLALGLMSKPMLVTLPFVLLLLDYWPLKRWKADDQVGASPPRQSQNQTSLSFLILEKVPLLALAVGSSITTFIVQRAGGAVQSADVFPLQERVINAFVSYLSYLQKTVWPSGLSVFYAHPGNALPVWKGLVSAALLVVFTAWVIRVARRLPYLAVGWFWYLGTLIPVIGVVQVGAQAMADRYAYVPLIGIFIIAAWGLPDFLATWNQREKTPVLFAGLLAPLMVVTWMQVNHWKNGITLFQHTISVTHDKYREFARAHNNLGIALKKKGRLIEAITQYKTAIKVNPDFSKPYNNLGNISMITKNFDEAIRYYKESIRISPDYANAYSNLGTVLLQKGEKEEAVVYLRDAIRINPDLNQARTNLGTILSQIGEKEEAIVHLREAVKINPDLALGHFSLGNVLFQTGETEEAITHYREAVRIKPDYLLFRKILEEVLRRTKG
ncbi:MAG: tetratricopeptide repeat protein [Nitrospina sp.]|nr:tetratricopeptide repeat protein [Nitrospina sp.]MBT3855467.1 tetratricopeptide repeat protein [Nitrospina sp.]MBT4103670.1 tetratricopeptide repeat protein [Nitrospina sp.]MBT4388417.1 tetratricopeptide repeat protein [Nitrospina sp.]MBT4621405.1 tetratricopeptide repeat protein [Nitrospina sp.]